MKIVIIYHQPHYYYSSPSYYHLLPADEYNRLPTDLPAASFATLILFPLYIIFLLKYITPSIPLPNTFQWSHFPQSKNQSPSNDLKNVHNLVLLASVTSTLTSTQLCPRSFTSFWVLVNARHAPP
jgi:ABC-type maltose transport system permease subunit